MREFHHQLIETQGVVIILDCEVPEWVKEEIPSLTNVEVRLLEKEELSSVLELMLRGLLADLSKNVCLLFPGDSSRLVEAHLGLNAVPSWHLHAKRFWQPGDDPFVTVGQVHTNRFLHIETDAVVVLDDVISSGMTMQLVHERNAWKFPRARWYASTLVSRGRNKRIRAYEKVLSSVVIRHPTDPARSVPINSLSTLLSDSEIAESYSDRNFTQAGRFLELLDEIRNQRCVGQI